MAASTSQGLLKHGVQFIPPLRRWGAGSRGWRRRIFRTAEEIANVMQAWFEQGACDGFNITPPLLPGGCDDFVEMVIPVLQHRGLFRTEYAGATLREHLGLKPAVSRYARAAGTPTALSWMSPVPQLSP